MTHRSIKIRDAALSDLDGITEYTFKAFGALALSRYLHDLQRVFTIISQHPEIGVAFASNVRRFAVGQHWIYYSYTKKTVRIIRILPQKAVQKLSESSIKYGPHQEECAEISKEPKASNAKRAVPALGPHPAQSAP